MKKSRFSDSQIMTILKQAEAGTPVSELCREYGMSNASFYKWRSRFGGMDASMMAGLKELEDENRRHQKDVCRRAFKIRDHSGGHGKKVVKPSRRREMARHAVSVKGISIRLACSIFGLSESGYRYCAKLRDENVQIANWLTDLTARHRSWGFDLCFLFLRNVKGFYWNHKRIYRIYCELKLNLRIKPKQRLIRPHPAPLVVPDKANHTWSMDIN